MSYFLKKIIKMVTLIFPALKVVALICFFIKQNEYKIDLAYLLKPIISIKHFMKRFYNFMIA